MDGQLKGIVPVILCGGSGTRLWPRSRAAKPKPFLPLVGSQSLFVETLLRCAMKGFAAPVVVAGTRHLAHVEAQIPAAAGEAEIIVEPAQRNTAAAIALAARRLPGDAVMLVCPSDHHIGDVAAFSRTAFAAAELARDGWLVAVGIEPRSPETGFGYIMRGAPLGEHGYKVDRFVEKPSREVAERLLAAGGHDWNGGIFAFTAETYLAELARHRPEMAAGVAEAVARGHSDGRRFHPDAPSFESLSSESIDYAVMENTELAAVVPAAMDWSDIGNWEALHRALDRDAAGNSVQGDAELLACRNVLVSSDGPRVSVIGAEDLIVVVDGGEVLVTTRAGAQLVGRLSAVARQ